MRDTLLGMRALLGLCLAFSALCLPALAQESDPAVKLPSQMPTTGFGAMQFIPDVELPRIDGAGMLKLSDLRGQKVLLIHFASWSAASREAVSAWHLATAELRAAKKLTLVGVVQEQNPEHAQLFAQWHAIDWPILWDAFHLLDLEQVPLVCALDGYGQVRGTSFDPARVELAGGLHGSFVEPVFHEPIIYPRAENLLHQDLVYIQDPRSGTALAALQALGLMVYRSRLPGVEAELFDHGVKQLGLWAAREEALAADLFRLGVALRLRWDSPFAHPEDFAASLSAWNAALKLDPGQFIWQQRLALWQASEATSDAYSWTAAAQASIRARGEEPIRLRMNPTPSSPQSPR
ncbi:MAG: peroxiredoxin [Planctomycetota bacterium]|jgi:peroxiredoxin